MAFVAFVGLAASPAAAQVVVADFAQDYQVGGPASGWAYLWNPLGAAVHSPAGYVPMPPVTGSNPLSVDYSSDGGGVFPRPSPGAFLRMDEVAPGFIVCVPGHGSAQAGDGLQHAMVTAFTVATGGPTQLVNGLTTIVDPSSSDGVQTLVFLNGSPTPLVSNITLANQSTPFAFNFGNLNVGDIVYVAVLPRSVDNFDSFTLQWQLTQPVPEPSALVLVLVVGAGARAYGRWVRCG